MGFLRSLIAGVPDPVVEAAGSGTSVVFAGADSGIDAGVLYGTPSLDDYIFGAYKVARREALAVPSVKRARDLIVGGIGQFPLRLYDADNRIVDWSLLSQPEAGVAASVTWGRVVEDLLLDGRSWLRVDALGWHGRPVQFVRLDPESVSVQPRTVSYGYGSATVWPEVSGLVRVDSPHDGLLTAGAQTIRALSLLERSALTQVSGGIPPHDYFTPAEGADLNEDDVRQILDDWATARKARSTGFIPAALDYHQSGWSPKDLQLGDARTFAITEIARLTGIEAEALAVPVTSRDYFNAQDRRRERVEDVLGPFMTAIEQRIGMDDITPRGFTVRFDTTAYLRLDDAEAAAADVALVTAGVLTRDEARAKRGLEPLADPAPVPEPAHAEEVAAGV